MPTLESPEPRVKRHVIKLVIKKRLPDFETTVSFTRTSHDQRLPRCFAGPGKEGETGHEIGFSGMASDTELG